MLCDICHTREAKIMYTEIINGQKREQHLCETCAGEQTLAITGKLGNELNIGSILSGILQNYAKGLAAKTSNEPVCQRCGMTASTLIKGGRVGCPECYNAFSMILEKNLKTVQGAVEHHGKVPVNASKIEINTIMQTGRTAAEVMKEATDEIARKNSRTGRKVSKAKIEEAKKVLLESVSKSNIADYQKRLKKAVEAEDYEEAARLRDLIRQTSGEGSTAPKAKTAKKAGKEQAKEPAKKTVSAMKAGKAATGAKSTTAKASSKTSSSRKGGKA